MNQNENEPRQWWERWVMLGLIVFMIVMLILYIHGGTWPL